jgi:tetratricopeptide (TPR) repeat protein
MRLQALILFVSTLVYPQTGRDTASIVARGQKLVETGDIAAAQNLYDAALIKSPDDPDVRFELGMLYFRQHDWQKAVDNLEVSSHTAPAHTKTLYYLAEAYFFESDFDRARETIAQAAAIAPEDSQICQKYGEYLAAKIETRREGLLQLQKARRLNPRLEHIDFDIGKTQFELTDYPSAALSFQAALQKDPADGHSAFFLAEASTKLEDWQKAREFFDYSLKHGYATGATYYGLGRAFAELGEFAAAVDPLRHALVLQPSLIQAHFQLGRAYRQLGQQEEAQHETTLFAAMNDRVDTSAELQGTEEDAAWRHVKPLLESHQEQKAIDYLATLPIASSPGGPYYLLGAMYFSAGQAPNAERLLSKAEALAPSDARIPAYLGMMQMSSGEIKAAEASFQSALRLESDNALALIGMGGLRFQQQRWTDAITYLEKSRTADPNTLLLLCDAYFRVGNKDAALITAEVVRAFGSDRPQVLDALNDLIRSSEHQSVQKNN